MASQSSPLDPTFKGHIASTLDALILFEGCLSGQLNHVPRRPHDRERQDLIRSGNVFIYEEHASGIKRWTDGVSWSPSRILGNFLIYRELEKPFPPGEKKRALKKNKKCQQGINKTDAASRPSAPFSSAVDPSTASKDAERALIGSLIDSYPFKSDGLVKKTISVTFQGVPHHLVSYYNINDVTAGRLSTPSQHPILRNIGPRAELLMSQNFRAPIDEVEYNPDDRVGPPPAFFSLTATMAELGSQLPRAMSLPSFHPAQSAPYPAAPNYGFSHPQLPPQQHHSQQHHPQQQPHQAPYIPPVPSAGPPPVQYAPQSQGNYALDPSRATRFPSSTGIAHEFPRNMPPHSPPRRHSTFEVTQSSEMAAIALSSFPEGRQLPAGNPFLNAPSYYLPHRPASIVEHGQSFPSPRQLKAEPDTLGGGEDGVSQPYNLEDNNVSWGFDGLDGASDHHYFGGGQNDGSQQWPGGPNGPNSLNRT